MKTRPVLLLAAIVVTTFIPAVCTAASSAEEFKPFRLDLKPGSSPATVRTILGAPDATLGPDVWIYWRFAPNPNRDNPEFDTLVVAFKDDRVTAVKITDERVVREWLAQAARYANNGAVPPTPPKRRS